MPSLMLCLEQGGVQAAMLVLPVVKPPLAALSDGLSPGWLVGKAMSSPASQPRMNLLAD